jgi:hypothetical protein
MDGAHESGAQALSETGFYGCVVELTGANCLIDNDCEGTRPRGVDLGVLVNSLFEAQEHSRTRYVVIRDDRRQFPLDARNLLRRGFVRGSDAADRVDKGGAPRLHKVLRQSIFGRKVVIQSTLRGAGSSEDIADIRSGIANRVEVFGGGRNDVIACCDRSSL